MFAHIPSKLKLSLTLVTIPCGSIVAAYFLLQHLGHSDFVAGKNWFMATIIAATAPVLVFKVAHLPVHRDQAVNKSIESLFSVGLFTWLGAFACLATGYYAYGVGLLTVSILLIGRAHLKWVGALLTPNKGENNVR